MKISLSDHKENLKIQKYGWAKWFENFLEILSLTYGFFRLERDVGSFRSTSTFPYRFSLASSPL